MIELAILAVNDVNIQARNAFMQRNLDAGDDPRGSEWEDDIQSKAVRDALEALQVAAKKMRAVRVASSYDPKAPMPR